MIILAPSPHITIWGGNKLIKYCENVDSNLGHLYMVNGHSELSNIIMNGSEKGKTLNEVFPEKKAGWNMLEYEEFPLTIALVDAKENLSIQVHPDDVIAQKLENKKIGKNESWLFLDAPESGWIYAGCECTSINQVEKKCKANQMEEIASRFMVRQGDCVSVSAGTLHAMTAGSLVYEIEFGSDYTYRFYDYNRIDETGRKRELQVEKALQSIKTEVEPRVQASNKGKWIVEAEYEICEYSNVTNYINKSLEIECISLLEAEGEADSVSIKGGMSILLFPGESISGIDVKHMIVARLRH